MELLIQDTGEILELEVETDIFGVGEKPEICQYSNDWEWDCPKYLAWSLDSPNSGYIISQDYSRHLIAIIQANHIKYTLWNNDMTRVRHRGDKHER